MSQLDLSNLRRIAAFSAGDTGGNPAGVQISDTLPSEDSMQAIAARVGYSESVFASPEGDAWRVRYFAPEREVDFCGHATIALGAALTDMNGPGIFRLNINVGQISVASTTADDGQTHVALTSPPTKSGPVDSGLLDDALALFGLTAGDLDASLPPAIANAGVNHLVLALRDREKLAAMTYDLETGRDVMQASDLVTISLLWVETPRRFHARNAFASGGVVEDPATGAAAAALGGYLRDLNWPHGGQIDIEQGFDMGVPSKLHVTISKPPGAPVTVAGTTRDIV